MSELQCFSNDCDYIIAKDLDDAWSIWTDTTMESRAEAERRGDLLEPVSADSNLSIWCDDDGTPTVPDRATRNSVTLPIAKWIERCGRGWLCSEDY